MYDRPSEGTLAQKLMSDFEHMRNVMVDSFDKIYKRLEKLENKLEERIKVNGKQNENITELSARLEGIEEGIASMQNRFADMEERITKITEGLVDTVKNTTVKAWTILAGIATAIGAMIYIVERVIK